MFTIASRAVWQRKDSSLKSFLIEEYVGLCQICQAGFTKRDGEPYAEAILLTPTKRGVWTERPGNVLCLCPTCAAKFQHGTVDAPDFAEQVEKLRLANEGGDGPLDVHLSLCGQRCAIRYSERHLLDLQALLAATESGG